MTENNASPPPILFDPDVLSPATLLVVRRMSIAFLSFVFAVVMAFALFAHPSADRGSLPITELLAFITTLGAIFNATLLVIIFHNIGKTRVNVGAVGEEVTTANGLTMANLADRAEGRRIVADIPPEDRTESEDRYVKRLEEDAVREHKTKKRGG